MPGIIPVIVVFFTCASEKKRQFEEEKLHNKGGGNARQEFSNLESAKAYLSGLRRIHKRQSQANLTRYLRLRIFAYIVLARYRNVTKNIP